MRRFLVMLMLVGAVGGGGWWLWHLREADARTAGGKPEFGKPGGEAQRPTPVTVAKVERRDMPVVLEGLGTAAGYYTVTVKSQVEGRLLEVPFKEGQAVKKGDLLAQLDPRPFAISLHASEAVHARDLAQLKNARLNLARTNQLRRQSLVPAQQLSDQQAQVDQLEAQLRGDVAQIENAKLLLDYARITAPIDGVTGVRLVDPGNLVRPTDATGIVVVTQIAPIAVFFTLPEDELPAVQRGMLAGPLTVRAYARDGVTLLATGQLEVVDNQINQATATARLKAVFANPDHLLWPNQFVKARLQVATRPAATVIPAVAVQHGPKGTFVYVAAADSTAAMRPVTVTALEADEAIIASGVEAGEQVVVDGQNRLKPGARIVIPGEKGGSAPAREDGSGRTKDGGDPATAAGKR